MEPNNSMFDTTEGDQPEVIFTTELAETEKIALSRDVVISPAEYAELVSEKHAQEAVASPSSERGPQAEPGVIPEVESLQCLQTPLVPETLVGDNIPHDGAVRGPDYPTVVSLQPHIDVLSKLDDPAASPDGLRMPKYPVFMATPMDDPAAMLTESMKDGIYLNNPDMRATSYLDTDTVDRLDNPPMLERLPSTTTLLIKYPLEWLELNPIKIQVCKLPTFGTCKIYYSHPLGVTNHSTYLLTSNGEDGNVVLTNVTMKGNSTAAGYQGETLVTPPVSTLAKTGLNTPKPAEGALDSPVCDAIEKVLQIQSKTNESGTDQKQHPRVLFLHGFDFDTSINAPFINALSRKYEILTFDWPATGGSDRTPDDVYDTDILIKYCLEVLSLPAFNWIPGFELYDEVPEQAAVPPAPQDSDANATVEAGGADTQTPPQTMPPPKRKYRILDPTPMQQQITIVGHSSGGLMAAIMAPILRAIVKDVKLLAPVGMTMEHGKKATFVRKHPTLTWMSQPIMTMAPSLALKTILSCSGRVKHLPEPLQSNVRRKYESYVRTRCSNAMKQVMGTSNAFPWTTGKDHFVCLEDMDVQTTLVLANDDKTVKCAKAKDQFEKYCPKMKIAYNPTGGHDFHLVYPIETMKLCGL